MTAKDWTIRSLRIVLPDGIRPACVRVKEGRIEEVCPYHGPHNEDVGNLVVMPGLVDTHVHLNEPGRTLWEGFEHATRAAAAGGITTIVDMPLNSIPPTTSVSALHKKIARAEKHCWVDVGFWGGIVPHNHSQIGPLIDAGCLGFKCFLTPSGVEEFPPVSEADLRQVAPELYYSGAVLLAHAELPEFLRAQEPPTQCYNNYLDSRPASAEYFAIKLLANFSRETGVRVHIVHLSSSEGVQLLQALHKESLPMTAETCPHYLTFAADDIPDGATEFKCAPPIRTSTDRESLWHGLRTGDIDMIVSDHSPCPPELKHKEDGDFSASWGGITSLQLCLHVVWTEARKRGFTIANLVHWMAEVPSRLAGLAGRKGRIARGFDADFVVWDPDQQFTVRPRELHHRHTLTPYAGMQLFGAVKKTYLRGEPVSFENGPCGVVLKRQCNATDYSSVPVEAPTS